MLISYHSFVMWGIILEVPGRGMIRTVNLTGDLHHTGIRGKASGGRTGESNERTTIWMEVNKIYIYITVKRYYRLQWRARPQLHDTHITDGTELRHYTDG